MRNILFFLAICLLVMQNIFASGTKEETKQTEVVTISYYDWQLTENPAGDIVRKQLAQYEQLHPNVKIELQPVPTAQRGDMLMTMVLGGQMPDIVHVNETDIARFVPMNSFESLEKYLAQNIELKLELIPAMTAMTTFNRQIYGIPRFASINTMIYNAEHFRQAGLDPNKPPATWDELAAYGKKLTSNNRWGIGILGAKTGSVGFRYWWTLWGAGGEILSPDNKTSLLDSQASIDAIRFYTDLALNYQVVPPGAIDVDYTTLVNEFIQEKTSIICDGPWQVGRIQTENPKIDIRVAPMPTKNASIPSATTGGGGFLGLSATGKNKDTAWDIIQFLSNAKNHWEYATEGFFLPCRQDTSVRLKNEGYVLLGEFGETLKYSRLTPAIPEMTQISMLLAEEIQFVLIRQKTAEVAAASLNSRVNELLQK